MPASREPTPGDPRALPGRFGSQGYAYYVLSVCFTISAFGIVDRFLFGLMIEPIKAEFGVSDTVMGLLAGFAFAAFYTVVGIPVARWADRGVRRSIMALGLFLWSLMTVGCGLAQNLVQLALARILVGIGEAAGAPPGHSLLTDYFPPERRGQAMSMNAMGGSLGLILAFVVGGWLAEEYGWRTAFVVVGAPGIVMALVVRFTVWEPPRGRFDPPGASIEPATTRETLGFLLRIPTYWHIVAAGSLHSFAGIGASQWNAVFLMRVHGFGLAEAGMNLALLNASFAALAIGLSGFVADRLGRSDVRWYQWLPACGTLIHTPAAVAFLLWPDPNVAVLFLPVSAFFGGFWAGPGIAMALTLAKPQMRATASALALLVMNLIGLGLGPTVVGILNDALEPSFGHLAVRYSLLIIAVTSLWGGLHNYLAARALPRDLRATEHAMERD
jgi:MFS family permease